MSQIKRKQKIGIIVICIAIIILVCGIACSYQQGINEKNRIEQEKQAEIDKQIELEKQAIQQQIKETRDNFITEINEGKDTWKDYLTEEQINRIDELVEIINATDSTDLMTECNDEIVEIYADASEVKEAVEQIVYTNTSTSSSTCYSNGSGLTMQSGVNYYDGRKETYYSSNVLYHYRTSEWTVDSEGFYRTSEGYYVVAASDMSQGTTFEGSKGTCIVLDSGCAAGTTDYYVKW